MEAGVASATRSAIYRADVVGSLLRPPWLIQARQEFRAGSLALETYKEIEDRAVAEALAIQEHAGVDVVTDGEMRRDIFFDLFVNGMTGFSRAVAYTVRFRGKQAEDAMEVQVPFAVTDKNGVLVALLRFPPVIATLCSLFVLLGLAQDLAPTPHEAAANWTNSLSGSIGPIPWALVILAIPVLLWTLLGHTPFRRTLYCVGDDDVAAFTSGTNVAGARIVAYALGGLIAALSGLALTASSIPAIRASDCSTR